MGWRSLLLCFALSYQRIPHSFYGGKIECRCDEVRTSQHRIRALRLRDSLLLIIRYNSGTFMIHIDQALGSDSTVASPMANGVGYCFV